MADEGQTGPGAGEGKVHEGTQDISGITEGTTDTSKGQSDSEKIGTTDTGTQKKSSEETFFDSTELPDELQPAYKNMQRQFTKKMQGIAKGKQKIDAYDAFMADPVKELQRMAGQLGYTLSRAGAEQVLQQQTGQTQQGTTWEPQSWDEVLEKAEERAYARLQQETGPLKTEVTSLRKENLETFLDTNAPDWREHEDAMMENLRTHPTLVNDPIKLYRLSVPMQVIEGRAAQKALKKLEDKGQSAKIGGGSQTTRQAEEGIPNKAMSFDESVAFAKKQLAAKGMKAPG